MNGPRGRRRRGRDVNGILLLDKPIGLSSNRALQRAKRLFDARKAGHTGNLDVLASGLLPLCFGEATKVCQFLLDADKRYVAEITFGRSTTTGDAEGAVIAERPTDDLTRARIETEMTRFMGLIEQVPPMHSALKRDGQPLYKLARQGIEVERVPRQVRIDRFDLTDFDRPRAEVDISCSKGTYVRTLAEDLGAALGCGAHVTALRRDRAGPFSRADAVGLDELERVLESGGLAALDDLLLSPDSALIDLPRIQLSARDATCLEQGQAVCGLPDRGAGLLRLYDATDRFIGVGEVLDNGCVAPRRLMRAIPSGKGENSALTHARAL